MIRKYVDKKARFISLFDDNTGSYVRTGIIENGKDTGVDPFMASFPQLIDVGVMGSCIHGKTGLCLKAGVECYQDGFHSQKPNMTLDNFKKIVDECSTKGCFQLALGGCGDVDQHENFEEILSYCREKGIIPNFTSSGLGFTPKIVDICKKYCGAVAISWYRSPYTIRALEMLVEAGIITNIHYVLGNNSIDEAIDRLKNNSFPKGITNVIFLMHKPVGLGTEENVLKMDDPRVKEFFELVDNVNTKVDFQIGFDSCSIPGIMNFTKNIDNDSLDTCEGGRFSMYISANMIAIPCSFDNQELKWGFDISGDKTIQDAWDSKEFDNFRSHFQNSCMGCKDRVNCMGGCPIRRQIVLCDRDTKDLQ